MTGNGGFNVKKNNKDTNPGRIGNFSGTTDFAESFIKFKYQSTGIGKGNLTLADWFIPFADFNRTSGGDPDYQDQDLGSGAPILPMGTNLVLGAGKDGILYVLDRNNLGKKKPGDLSTLKSPAIYVTFNGSGLRTNPPVDFPLGGADPGQGPPKKTHHLHASPVYWKGPTGPRLFDWGENESLRSWSVNPNTGAVNFLGKSAEIASRAMALDPNPASQGGMTGGMLALSSNGTNNGIVWTLTPIDRNANKELAPGIARAYDATTFDTGKNADGTTKVKLLWDSTKAGVNFTFSKFCPPMVADGRLYVPTYDGRVDVYQLNQ